jgi:fibronectin type 3 domain-containing protein
MNNARNVLPHGRLAHPSGVTATPSIFGGSINLAWTLNATGITTLSIYRATDGGAYSLLTDSISTSATSYSDSTIVEGHDYSYQFQATFSGGTGNFSDPAEASAEPIQNLTPVPDTSTTGVTLNWFNFSPFASAIEVDDSTDGTTFTALTTTLDGSSSTYDATGLTANSVYYFRLKITDDAGTTTSGIVYTSTLPPAPTDLASTSAAPTEVDLSWTNNASSSTPVFIERSDDGGTDYNIIDEVSGTASSYQDTSVTDGTSYMYQVDAVGLDGFDANPSTATSSIFAPLAAPTQLTLTQNGPNEVDLSWSNPSQSATGYVVQRSTDGTSFSDVGTIAYADDSFFSDTGLSAGTQYYYRVKATDADSDLSAATAVATTVTAPGLSIPDTNASTVYEGSTYTLSTGNIIPSGEVDPIQGWTVNWGDGNTTNASGLANGDPGSFTHIYTTTGFYTITASTIDGSFSGTQNVEAEYGSPGGRLATPTISGSGLSFSVNDTYTDPAGHHVSSWVVSWGDGAIQTYTSSDSSTDGSDSNTTSTDTKSFTHTYADAPNYDYNVAITAVTDENVYQAGTVAAATTDVSWSSDTLAPGTASSSPTLYPTPIDGLADAEVTLSGASSGGYDVNWGDGSSDTTFSSSDSDVVSPARAYSQAGTYVVTITETPDGGGTLTGHAFMPIAAGAPTMPTISDQVLSAGAALGITEAVSAASGDPLFATIVFDNGTAPRAVPITDGAIDLSAVDVPSNFVGDQASDGISTFVNAFNAAAQGVVKQQGFTTDAWNAAIGNGASDDLLWASSDGTQSVQPVVFSFPRPTGGSNLSVTITSTDLSEDVLWATPTPSSGDTPLLGGASSPSNYTFTLTPDQTAVTFGAAALVGDMAANVDSYRAAAVPTIGADAVVAATQSVSNAEFSIHLVENPNLATPSSPLAGSNLNVTDQVNKPPTDWVVGQVATLNVVFVDPQNSNPNHPPKYFWDVKGPALFNWGWEAGQLQYSSTKGAQPITPVPESQWQSSSQSIEDNNTENVALGGNTLGKRQKKVAFFWRSTDDGVNPSTYVITATVSGIANLPELSHTATFKVYEPTVSATSVAIGKPVVAVDPAGAAYLGLGDPHNAVAAPGLKLTAKVTDPAVSSGGTWAFLQLAQIDQFTKSPIPNSTKYHYADTPLWNHKGWILDGGFAIPGSTLGGQIPSGTQFSGTDTPNLSDGNDPKVTAMGILDSFDDFIMYRPVGAGSHWVAVQQTGEFTVHLGAVMGKNGWNLANTIVKPAGVNPAQPNFHASTEEPSWDAETPGTVGTNLVPLVEYDGT